MPNVLNWYVGNRNPSITETITVNGVAFDLSSSTVKAKMRALGSSTLKVDTAATIVSAPAGTVRYDWAAADVDTAGNYLFWWEVTTSARTQDMGEAIIQFFAHAPVSKDYVEFEEMRAALELAQTSWANIDLKGLITTASRAIDDRCDRHFWTDTSDTVRYYSPTDPWTLRVDDINSITTLKTDDGGDGTFENTWTLNTDYTKEPLNAALDLEPWTKLCVHPAGTHWFPTAYPRSVEITGKFGWPAVPAPVKSATILLTHRLVKRQREAPTGVAGFGMDGVVVRMMANDPDITALLEHYMSAVLIA